MARYQKPDACTSGFFSVTRYWLPSERDDPFWSGRPRGLDGDPDHALGRMQRFDDQDAAGVCTGRNHCSVFRRGLATAAFVQRHLVLVVSAHSGRLGYLLMVARLGTRLLLKDRGSYLEVL
jgi:hypothetical protein